MYLDGLGFSFGAPSSFATPSYRFVTPTPFAAHSSPLPPVAVRTPTYPTVSSFAAPYTPTTYVAHPSATVLRPNNQFLVSPTKTPAQNAYVAKMFPQIKPNVKGVYFQGNYQGTVQSMHDMLVQNAMAEGQSRAGAEAYAQQQLAKMTIR